MAITYNAEDIFKLNIPGSKIRELIARRVGEIEEDVATIKKQQAAGAGPSFYTDVALRRGAASLAAVADLIEPGDVYVMSLGDLEMLGILHRIGG